MPFYKDFTQKHCKHINPWELKPSQRKLHNMIAWAYPREIIQILLATPNLREQRYHILYRGLKNAEDKCSFYLATLISKLSRKEAMELTEALETINALLPDPIVRSFPYADKPIFYDREREELYHVVNHLARRGIIGSDHSFLPMGDFRTIQVLYSLQWERLHGRHHGGGRDPAYYRHVLYHKKPQAKIQELLSLLRPVAQHFGFEGRVILIPSTTSGGEDSRAIQINTAHVNDEGGQVTMGHNRGQCEEY